jgi:hypothetical protein
MARRTTDLSSMKSEIFLRARLDRANQIELACEIRVYAQAIFADIDGSL